jgi:hypothetical protein
MPSTLHTPFGISYLFAFLCVSFFFDLPLTPLERALMQWQRTGGVADQENRFADHVPIPATEAVHRTYRSTKSTHRKATK